MTLLRCQHCDRVGETVNGWEARYYTGTRLFQSGIRYVCQGCIAALVDIAEVDAEMRRCDHGTAPDRHCLPCWLEARTRL